MGQDDIHERSGGLFVPETLLATQYFDRIRRRKDLTGEQRLLFAVIEDAVDMYLKHAGSRHPGHQVLFSEAERWIESNDRGWLYSFQTICDHLGLDGDYVRAGLRARKAEARGTPPAAPITEIADPTDLSRASNE